MHFQFRTKALEELYCHEKGAENYPPEVIDAFFNCMAIIKAAKDEKDLFAFKSLRCEKSLITKLEQKSIQLNSTWCLLFTTAPNDKKTLLIDFQNF